MSTPSTRTLAALAAVALWSTNASPPTSHWTLIGALTAAALTAATHDSWPQPGGWLAAAYIGLGPMAAGYGLWTVAMARGGAEHLAPLGYTTPLLSTLLLLATGAPATATTLIGVGLVLTCSLGVLVNRGPEARAHGAHKHRGSQRREVSRQTPEGSPRRTHAHRSSPVAVQGSAIGTSRRPVIPMIG